MTELIKQETSGKPLENINDSSASKIPEIKSEPLSDISKDEPSGVTASAVVSTADAQPPNEIVVQTTPTGGDPTPVSQGQFKFLWEIVIAISTLAVIALITLVIQYFTATQATYQNLVNQVTAQNAKIDNFNILLNQATVQNVKVETFQNLANQVTAQNAKIDTLIQLNIKK